MNFSSPSFFRSKPLPWLCLLLTTPLFANNDSLSFFETNIRPVLIESCYECHNSHDKQKGGLILDHRQALLKGGDSGPALIPGKPDESLLIATIRHEEQDMEMPFKAPKLDDKTISHFKKWILMGAPDPREKAPKELVTKLPWELVRDRRAQWWSFLPVSKTKPPANVPNEWSQNPIDAFIYAEMQKNDLKPSPLADRYTLLRRLHLILKGTPPTINEIESFINDTSVLAYEKVVDQLLASESFGIRWARHWMDWYRYAESHGSEGDPRIPQAHAYRDYLIRALNHDISYKQMLIEHLAGDLIDSPRLDRTKTFRESSIATAHYRMVPHGFGVTDAYDEMITFTDNQIDVITKATMGLTLSCARCHNHKFDPLSQKDYTRFFGIMLSNKHTQIVTNTKEHLHAHKLELQQHKQSLKQQLIEYWMSQESEIKKRLETLPVYNKKLKVNVFKNKKANNPLNELNFAGLNLRINHIFKESHPLYAYLTLRGLTGPAFRKELELQKTKLESVRQHNQKQRQNAHKAFDLRTKEGLKEWFVEGNGNHDDIIPDVSKAGEFSILASGNQIIRGVYPRGLYSQLLSDKHYLHLSSKNFEIQRNHISFRLVGGQGSGARYVVRNYPLTHGGLHPGLGGKNKHWTQHNMQWATLPKFPYWKGDQAHLEISTAGDSTFATSPTPDHRSWIGVSEIIIHDQPLKEEGASMLDLGTDKLEPENLLQSYVDVIRRCLHNWQSGQLGDQEAFFLSVMLQNQIIPNNISDLNDKLKQAVTSYRDLESKVIVPQRVPGLREGQIVDAPLLNRGNYRKEGDLVPRGFLEVFDETKYSKQSSGRLELAHDIASDTNPLTTRVLINRLWDLCMGQGLVSTTDNFGRLGKKPSHPELLDYMSATFIQDNWSIKRAIRRIVTSNTFKRSSQASAQQLEIDQGNRYLSYYNARRLDAEGIRDTLYAIGNPHTKRSIYLPVIRNRLDSFLTAFDAPVPMSTVSHRLRTNVPAQALTMMNGLDSKITDSIKSKVLQSKTDSEKIKQLFLMLISRPATQQETQICSNILKDSTLDFLITSLLKTKEVIYVR